MATVRALRAAAKREFYRRDFPAFAAEQLKIKPRNPGALIPFTLDSGQRRLLAAIEANRKKLGYVRVVTLKGRQSGWSTLVQGLCFQAAALNSNFSTLLLAVDDDSTRAIFQMAHLFYQEMDADIRPLIKYSTKREIVYQNPDKYMRGGPGLRSRMDFQTASNLNAGTGTTRQAHHWSEVAKWLPQSVEDLKTSLLPSIHPLPGTVLIQESTAFAGGEYFREMCERARSGDSSYGWCFSPWWLCDYNVIPLGLGEKITPNSDEKILMKLAAKGQREDDVPPHKVTPEQLKWYRTRLDEFGDLFEQEYPRTFESAWVERDEYVFNRDILRTMLVEQVREATRFIEILPGPKTQTVRGAGRPFADADYIAIWEEPQPGVQYDVGLDVSGGIDGGDWSVGQVIRRDRNEQVCEYHKRIDPVDLAEEAYWLGKYYNNAQMCVEMNNVGLVTGNRLALKAYPYIYMWRNYDRMVPKITGYAGFKTTYESKKILIGNTRHIFLHHRMIVRSRVLWDEMGLYVRIDENMYRAARGFDDAVMAWMLGLQAGIDESYGESSTPAPKQERAPTRFAYQSDGREFGPATDAATAKLLADLRG